MTNAQTILKMIEEVDPSDTAKLDEIDARVWCWLEGYEFSHMGGSDLRGNPDLCYFNAENPRYNASNFCEDSDNGKIEHSWNYGNLWWAQTTKFKKPNGTFKGYTRSRDALKEMRPEGYVLGSGVGGEIGFHGKDHGYEYGITSIKEFRAFSSEYLPTEELAELHAIIQAIEYERKANDKN